MAAAGSVASLRGAGPATVGKLHGDLANLREAGNQPDVSRRTEATGGPASWCIAIRTWQKHCCLTYPRKSTVSLPGSRMKLQKLVKWLAHSAHPYTCFMPGFRPYFCSSRWSSLGFRGNVSAAHRAKQVPTPHSPVFLSPAVARSRQLPSYPRTIYRAHLVPTSTDLGHTGCLSAAEAEGPVQVKHEIKLKGVLRKSLVSDWSISGAVGSAVGI